MKQKLLSLLRKSAVRVVLLIEAAILLLSIAAALQPQTTYEIQANQWEVLAQKAQPVQGTAGYITFAEEAGGEDVLRSEKLHLPAGHYRVTAEYTYKPSADEKGCEDHFGVYLMADDAMVVTGEKALFQNKKSSDTVVLNVRHTNGTIRLVVFSRGGELSLGRVSIRQDMLYAWVRVVGTLLGLLLLDGAVLLFVPESPLAIRDTGLRGTLLVLAAAVFLAILPLLQDGGGIYGDDINFHLARMEGVAQALREGQLPVRVYSIGKDGYGYAPSLFYGELLLYFPAVLRILGVSVQLSYQLYAVAVHILTAAIAFYSFRQIFAQNRIALMGTILYLLNPYRLQNFYWRAAVGEYTAMAFLPLIPAALYLLYGKTAPDNKQRRKAWAQLTIAFSLLLQTHMISMEMAVLLTGIFCLWNWRRTFTRGVLAVWLKAVAAVLALNLWFLLPFLEVMQNGLYQGMYGGTTMNSGRIIQQKGFTLAEVFVWNNFNRCVGLELGIGCVLFIWLWLGTDRGLPPKEKKIGFWAVGLGLACCLAGTNLFPWGLIGALPAQISGVLLAIQFPWRYLAPGTLLLIVGTLCAVTALQQKKRATSAMAVILAVSLLGAGRFYREFMPYETHRYTGDAGELVYADGALSNMTWRFDSLYLPEGTQESRDGFTHIEEAPEVAVTSLTRENGVTTVVCTEQTGEEQCVELPLLYYPGYSVVEGPGGTFRSANGLVAAVVPANFSGTIRVAFREPLRWRLADLLSAAALAVLAGRALCKKKKNG